MKMRNLLYLISVILITSSLIFISCEKEADIEKGIESKLDMLNDNDYFPLQVGNYWEFDFIPRRTIVKSVRIEDKDYYQQDSEYDTVYYRKDSDGKVYLRTKTKSEVLKFDLKASAGESWTYKYEGSDYTWNATLTSKNETIVLDNYTFKNCYRFYFDVPQLADEEHIIWLAPGVGIVEEAYLGGTSDRKELKKAKIMDIEIVF